MAEVRTFKCEKCGYNKEFYLGAGMLGGMIEYSQKDFSYEIQKQIKQWIEEHGYQRSEKNNLLGRCRGCGALNVYSELKLKGTDGMEIVFDSNCKMCGSDYETIETDKATCPDCNSELVSEVSGHWD